MSALIAERYFNYSNDSNMAAIKALLAENSTYYSSYLGFFVGREDIIAMQTHFHLQYQTVQWDIITLREININVMEITFHFEGLLQNDQVEKRKNNEHILVKDGVIQHIAVGLPTLS